jgi:uncharacterized protein
MKKYLLLTIFLPIFLTVFSQEKNIENPNGYNAFYYGNGQLASEGYMKDGFPDGFWKNYHVNGKLKSEGKRRNTFLDSVWTFYDEKGNVIKRINYLNGKKNGYLFEYKYRTDVDSTAEILYLFYEALFVENNIEGIAKFYFQNGNVKERYEYHDGFKDGLGYEYDLDGRIITIFEFARGERIDREKVNRYDEDGLKHGIWKEFFKNGKVKTEYNYNHGVLEGLIKEFNQKGELVLANRYENDSIIDNNVDIEETLEIRNLYYDKYNDKDEPLIKFTGAYKDGKPIGVHRFFDELGKVNSSKLYDTNGNLLGSGVVDLEGNKEGEWSFYYSSGEIRSKGFYKNNYREGLWKFYYKDNKVEQIGEFKRGKFDGTWKWYFKDGSLAREESFYRGREEGDIFEYDEFGNEIVKGVYFDGMKEGEWIINVGDYVEKGIYKNDVKEGLWKYFYHNEKKYFEGVYVNGYPDGKHRYFYKNGQLRKEEYYVMGIKEKNWKLLDSYGNVIQVETYRNNELVKINGVKVTTDKVNDIIE